MARPWMPFYVGDYLADTRHLSTLEHGAYVLLILHYWQKRGLPTDEERLRRVTGMTVEEWERSHGTLAALFDPGWKHKRIEFELTEAARISEAGRRGGLASGKARKNKANERPLNDRSNDQATIGQALQPQLQKKDRVEEPILPLPVSPQNPIATRAVADATRTDRDKKFEEFWKSYPSRGQAANPKKPAREKFDRAARSGTDPAEIITGAQRYAECERLRRTIGTDKIAMAVTWLNQERWKDYPATAPPDTEPVWKKPPPEYLEWQKANGHAQ